MKPDSPREAAWGTLCGLGLLALGVFMAAAKLGPLMLLVGAAVTLWFAYWLMELRKREQDEWVARRRADFTR